jgi:hypothetical protein
MAKAPSASGKALTGSDTPKGCPKCTGTAKTTGNRCRNNALPGRNACANHGGLAPGVQCLRSGLHTALPSRLAESYARGLEDATLLDQRRSVALMEALVEEMAHRIRTGETPEMVQAASDLANSALLLLIGGDTAGAGKLMQRLATLLHEGLVTQASHDKLFTMADRVGSRRDAAWTTKLQRIQVMNANDVATMLGLVLLRARAKWGEDRARELAELFENLLNDAPAGTGRGDVALAAITVEGQTVNGGTNGNAAAGS